MADNAGGYAVGNNPSSPPCDPPYAIVPRVKIKLSRCYPLFPGILFPISAFRLLFFTIPLTNTHTRAPSSCRRMRGSLTGRERASQRRPNINFYSGRLVPQKRFCGEVCVGTFPLMLSLVCSFCLLAVCFPGGRQGACTAGEVKHHFLLRFCGWSVLLFRFRRFRF